MHAMHAQASFGLGTLILTLTGTGVGCSQLRLSTKRIIKFKQLHAGLREQTRLKPREALC